jgi:penicillin-binding protein 2
LEWTQYNSRYYFEQGAASNIVGYTLAISPEELDDYRRRGYAGDERIGAAGLERWAEDYLAGQHGGILYVVNPSTGQIVTKVGENQAKAADSVYLTIDRNMQYYTEQALKPFTGAAVVLERDTGRVLAMASSPDFDSNAFQPDTPYQSQLLADMVPGSLLNRAAQGQYPLGSVFKIMTMAAGMESGLFVPETTFNCEYEWTLPDQVRHDWTWRAGIDYKRTGATPRQHFGTIDAARRLMRSCNRLLGCGYTISK